MLAVHLLAFCGATLLACRKKSGGLRPIAIGEVLRRLTSKCVSRAVQVDAIGVISPLQVGVGIPVGCESIVHSVASLQEDPNIPLESRCSLLVDFSNAFNLVDRGCMFQEVRSRILSMAAWVESCYGSQPLLYLGMTTFSAAVGFSRVTSWVPCALPSLSILLLSKLRGKFQACLSMFGTLMTGLCVGLPDTFALLSQ